MAANQMKSQTVTATSGWYIRVFVFLIMYGELSGAHKYTSRICASAHEDATGVDIPWRLRGSEGLVGDRSWQVTDDG